MFKKIVVGVCLTALVAGVWFASQTFASAEEKKSDEPVAAVVNGNAIYRKEVATVIDTLPFKGQVAPENIYPMIVDQMINERLIQSEADKASLTNDPEVQKKLEQVKMQIIRSVYLERTLGKKITDDLVKSEYEKFKKTSEGKEEIHARHILVKTEDEAKEVVKKLEGGGDFVALAKEASQDPGSKGEGGDLGYFAEEAMVPEFSTAAFKLKSGEYTKAPVKTNFGWHVIKVEDRRKKAVPSFDEMASGLRSKLGQEAVQSLLDDLRKSAKIERFGMDGKPMN